MLAPTTQLKKTAIIFTLLLTSVFSGMLQAELWLPPSLSDHILFWPGEPTVLWGKAGSNSTITAELTGEKSGIAIDRASTLAGADGCWRIGLKPPNFSKAAPSELQTRR